MEMTTGGKQPKWELLNISIALNVLEDDGGLPPEYLLASYHLIFNIKMDFTWKAHLVLDNHKTPDPEGSIYTGVLSR